MREPSPRTSRLAIAAGIVMAIMLIGAGFIAGRRSSPDPVAPAAIPAPPMPPAPASSVGVPAALDRGGLLAMVARAADAFTSNEPIPVDVGAAAGRRFDLVLPFGCEEQGAIESSGGMRWMFDPKAARLRVTVDPTTWRHDEWFDGAAGGAEPALRGFWITRPWSTATSCTPRRTPAVGTDGAPVVLPGETVAIARLIDPAEVGKTRAYEVVQRTAAADFDPQFGFRLRILGRIRPASDGTPIQCVQPGGGDQRPRCVIIASFAEVRIENPKTGALLASWPVGNDMRIDDNSVGAENATAPR